MNNRPLVNSRWVRRRGCVHGLCALLLAAVVLRLILDCRSTLVLALQIPLKGSSAFVAYRPDGRALITGAFDEAANTYAVDFWDTASGQPIDRIEQSTDLYSASFSPDGQFLALGTYEGAVLWNLSTRQVTRTIRPDEAGPIRQVTFSPDGRWIATLAGASISVWDRQDGALLGKIDDVSRFPQQFAVNPDSGSIAYVQEEIGATRRLCLWKVGHEDEHCVDQPDDPYSLAWSADGRQVTLGVWGGARLLEMPQGTGSTIPYVDHDFGKFVYNIAFNPVYSFVALSGEEMPAILRNVQTGALLGRVEDCAWGTRRCSWRDLTFSPDGQALALQLVTQDDDSATVQIWKPNAGHW